MWTEGMFFRAWYVLLDEQVSLCEQIEQIDLGRTTALREARVLSTVGIALDYQ